MGKSTIVCAAAAGLGLISFVFILVAICTNNWLVESSSTTGLWQFCTGNNECVNFSVGQDIKYRNYEMVRGFGVLAVAMVFLGFVFTIVSVVRGALSKKSISASIMATFFLMGAFFGVTCLGLFTNISSANPAWGYSYGLGWASFPFSLIAGALMVHAEFTSKE